MTLNIHPISAFTDNYIWIIHNKQHAIVIDPGEPAGVEAYLKENQLSLLAILITHHHHDHIDGVMPLVNHWRCDVYAPNDSRLPFKYQPVKEADSLHFPELTLRLNVLVTPGHTLTHVGYFNEKWLFCGDTLFSMGCGRMFEGTAAQFVQSLNKIKNIINNNNDVLVFCTHEYTAANLEFACYIDSNNPSLQTYQNKVKTLRKSNTPSLPASLMTEIELNPFLRTNNTEFQQLVSKLTNQKISSEITCFATLRKLKDNF